MAINGGYAPPGVYTQSVFESPTPQAITNARIPLFIGTGRETVVSNGIDLVRGSSSNIDQNIVEEDAQGRSVIGTNPNGTPIIGDFDGVSKQIQTKQFPIVSGDGTGTTSDSPSFVSATVNGEPVVVLSVVGATGLVSLSVAPQNGDDVRVSYFFNRTDTLIELEDLSSQVSTSKTTLRVASFNSEEGSNEYGFTNARNTLILTVDGVAHVVSLLALDTNKTENLSRLITQLNSASLGSLVADSYTTAFGSTELVLTADGSITVGNGSSNASFGFFNGQQGSSRTSTFFTHYNPIVDGSNGGVTTTSVSDIKVYVDDVEVAPSSLDGSTGAITLDLPPKIGQTVKVDYYFNNFKDQFDFIPARAVTQVTRVSETPVGGNPAVLYSEDVDWVLKDDKIIWGTSSIVSSGSVQEGATSFGSTQVSSLTKDDRIFNDEVSSVGGSLVDFKLNYIPVDGTGAGTPTSRTDVVQVKVGYTLAEALESSNVALLKVNPSTSTITLASPVLAGQKVFATYYYNVLQDAVESVGSQYTLEVIQDGGSNVGTYSVSRLGASLYNAQYQGKGADLSLSTLNFPSGSELISDARMGSGVAVSENISVKIESVEGNNALYISEGYGPYLNVASNDTMGLEIDGNTLETFRFSDPVLPTIVSNPLPYLASTNETDLGTITGDILLEIDGKAITGSLNAQANADVSHFVTAFNNASKSVPSSYTCMGSFPNEVTISAGAHDQLTLNYVGITALGVVASSSQTITLTANDYAIVDLAEHIEDQLLIAFDGVLSVLANADPDDPASSSSIKVTVDSGRLVFTLEDVKVGDEYGYLEFITTGGAGREFEHVAGIDTDSANGSQTKFGILPIANFTSSDLSGVQANGEPLRDRLVLKSRTLIGTNYVPPTNLGVTVVGGIVSTAGLVVDQSCPPIKSATLEPLFLTLDIGFGSQKAGETLPSVLVYNGEGNQSANNVLSFEFAGKTYTHTIVGSANGTEYGADALVLDIYNGFLNVEAISSSAHYHGSLLRFKMMQVENGYIKILGGSANSLFGLQEGDVVISSRVPVEACVAGLMGHSATKDASSLQKYLFSTDIKTTSTSAGEYFQKYGASFVYEDAQNRKFIGFESQSVGATSTIKFASGSALTTVGSGLKIAQNTLEQGEDPYQGFVVSSDSPSGSGSSNTSKISSNGNGQDGIVGQTYVDATTGFTFTLLQREGGLDYPTGNNATLSFSVSTTVKANGIIPVNVIAGVQLTVDNTVGANAGDTALVETFNKGGREPSIGQVYYLDIVRNKSAFGSAIFNSISDIVAEFGEISTENTLSMASYFAFLNGATQIALHQVPLASGESDLTTTQVLQAIEDVEGEVISGVNPSLIIPLVPANELILNALSRHCDIQSSLRFRSERTAIMGFNAGTLPSEAQRLSNLTRNARVRLVYPEIVSCTITNTLGVSQTLLLDGRYLAVAVASATTTGSIDVATPWTNLSLRGFNSLSRNLDAVEANLTAQNGVTVLQQKGNQIVIRQGLTTDMSSVLTKTPTVIQIADEVHRQARNLLGGYIGIKFLPSVLPQIEGRVNALFKDLTQQQIIDSFSGVSVSVDPEDPTSLLVEAFYKPVFPLLYIQFTFNIRSSI